MVIITGFQNYCHFLHLMRSARQRTGKAVAREEDKNNLGTDLSNSSKKGEQNSTNSSILSVKGRQRHGIKMERQAGSDDGDLTGTLKMQRPLCFQEWFMVRFTPEVGHWIGCVEEESEGHMNKSIVQNKDDAGQTIVSRNIYSRKLLVPSIE